MSETLRCIKSIQFILEQMPCGGIGQDGPTQEELDEAIESGHSIEDDSVYHYAQQAWLYAQEAIDSLQEPRRKVNEN